MATLEQVEKLREKADVSFEDAKNALDACGDDLLEALIYLEKLGKVKPPVGGGYYSSERTTNTEHTDTGETTKEKENHGESFTDMMRRFGRFCARIISKGNNNYFEAEKNGKIVISFPVTALVILVVFLFWIIVPLVIIGLFFGFRYHFRGSELGKESVNRVMDNASNTAEDIKRSFNSENK